MNVRFIFFNLSICGLKKKGGSVRRHETTLKRTVTLYLCDFARRQLPRAVVRAIQTVMANLTRSKSIRK